MSWKDKLHLTEDKWIEYCVTGEVGDYTLEQATEDVKLTVETMEETMEEVKNLLAGICKIVKDRG